MWQGKYSVEEAAVAAEAVSAGCCAGRHQRAPRRREPVVAVVSSPAQVPQYRAAAHGVPAAPDHHALPGLVAAAGAEPGVAASGGSSR